MRFDMPLPPELAWPSLRLVAKEVLPALAE